MKFSPFFGPRKTPQPDIALPRLPDLAQGALHGLPHSTPVTQPAEGSVTLCQPVSAETPILDSQWALPTQSAWLRDNWHLKIWEKSRQVGATLTDALHTVLIVSPA